MKYLLISMLVLVACTRDAIEHDLPREMDACGGTGGLCSVSCASDLECLDVSPFAQCSSEGQCESTVSCLSAEVCGLQARCSRLFDECAPLGTKPLGEACVDAAQCRSGGCEGVCLTPCVSNQDCDDEERCMVPASSSATEIGLCRVSTACDACDGPREVCDPFASTCVVSCRTAADCDGGDCAAWEHAPWTCLAGAARCPSDAFFFGGTCFVHEACEVDDDCPIDHVCRALSSTLEGGYCSPTEGD